MLKEDKGIMKKIVSIIIMLALLCGMIPMSVVALETHTHEYGSELTYVDAGTRESYCVICGAHKVYERLSLPLQYNGEVYIENNSEGLYYGSRNISDILGLKAGTYSNGDVTITIDRTNISTKGTPTKAVYFDLQKGTFGVPDYKRDPGYTIPDGNYRFGLLGAGTASPTACIRYPDGVGNIAATSSLLSFNNLSGKDFGIPYLYMPAGKTYDFTGSLVLSMGIDASYDGDTPDTEIIYENGIFTIDNYLWSLDDDIEVFGTTGSRDTGKIKYINGSKEYINIYLPREAGYLQIQLNMVDSETANAYGWRLNMMYACDNHLNQIFPITNSGEYEAAIKLIDRPDFMGMGAHGSERMTSFSIYIDGTEASLGDLVDMTDWHKIQILRESKLYDPLDESTLVATHSVTYDFDSDGLTVTQDVNWLVDTICVSSYMMMFPVRRTYNNLQVTDTYFDNFDPTRYDVSKAGFNTYPVKWTTGATKMTLYSEKSGVTATMESLETMQLTGSSYKMCANASSYNKLYFTVCGASGSKQAVTAGDNWHTKHRYEVEIAEGTDCFFGHVPANGICPACGQDFAELTQKDDVYNLRIPGISENAKVIVASYKDGRMISSEFVALENETAEIVALDGVELRIFVLDGNWQPIRNVIK